jgi:hypothetical protein
MPSLLSAAKYLVRQYGFTPMYNDDVFFGDPMVPAPQSETFQALHILASAANDTDPAFVSVKRVTAWLGQKAQAANV